ncbi:DNA-protecting protein DprA [Pontibacter qinzhouensis]|uniref:DNA-protecting protein DprA n=1 Tax=Pontibacter qinzhouensis TaxID=2603253 RepID=A0A5C8K6R5_9BACT|nr:DNA-processing protein DprA [Pontibacter qinzhouensis]TXK47651.1 DNA-protecting protein DprA [Pontibacter qinzhouensis]
MADAHLYEVALTLLPGIGGQLTRLLVSYCGSPKAVLEAPPGKLQKIPGIGPKSLRAVTDGARQALLEAEKIIRQAEELQVKLLFYTSEDYPDRLKQVADAPTLLYFKGKADLNQQHIVSMVGTRKPTAYGQAVTERIVEELKQHHVMVVSGLAYGIDIVSHRAALQHGLPTVGVIASGQDIIYPSAHSRYADKMMERGGILTESPFGTKPDAHRFPARNRIIAGMSDCTIVVEAAMKSGTLITADIAHSYDREVMAVPGNITSSVSEGTNYLLKTNKAAVYTSVQDLVELLNWDLAHKQSQKQQNLTLFNQDEFSADELKILKVLQQSQEEQMDNLSWKAQVPVSQLASLLLSLEFKGVVKALPGKRFSLLA